MKKQLIAVSLAAAALFAIASPASAKCVIGCGTPAPAPSPNLNFTVSGLGTTAGFAGSEASGGFTATMATESGISNTLVNLVGSGNACGTNCANVGWSAGVLAQQQASTSGLAVSGGFKPTLAMVQSASSSGASGNLTINKQ